MAYTFAVPVANPRNSSNKRLPQGTTMLDNQEVNPAWFERNNLRWNKAELKLPNDPEGTLFTPRGQDVPDFPRVNRTGKTPWATSKALGSLVFLWENNRKLYGAPDAKVQDGQIRFSVELDTQLPSLSFIYKHEMEKDKIVRHRVILHGNTAMKDVTYCSPASIKSGRAGVPIPPKHQKAAEEGRLVGLTVEFGQTKYNERYRNCVTIQHGSKEDNIVDRWRSNDDMIKTMGNKDDQDVFDAAIRDIFFGQDMKMVFLREIETVDLNCMAKADPEYKHWEHVMKLSIKFGPFWFYRMQPGFVRSTTAPQTRFTAWNEPDNPPPVPFWVVRKFNAIVEGKRLTKLIPLEWASLMREKKSGESSVWVLPNKDLETLVEELSIKREKAWELAAEKLLFWNARQHPTTIRWVGTLGSQAFYRVDIAVHTSTKNRTQSNLEDKVLPQPGSSIAILPRIGQKSAMDVTLQGRVVDELPIPGASQLVALCNLQRRDSELLQSLLQDREMPIRGSVIVRSNYMVADRMIAAFTGVVEEANTSIDARHILLGYESRLSSSLLNLSDVDSAILAYSRRHLGRKAGFGELCSWFGFSLNESQLNIILSFIRSGRGKMTAIHGLPGTGKTHTLACLAVVLRFVFGSKCAITAPSNPSCKAIMDKLLMVYRHTLEPRGMKWNLIRLSVSGAVPVFGDVMAPENLEPMPFNNTGIHELALHQRGLWTSDLRFGDHSFYQAKRSFAIDASSDPTMSDELIAASVDWLDLLQEPVTGDIAGAKMVKISKADDMIGRQVLTTQCDLLVGTLNSMGRLGITSVCPIDTLIIDDGAGAMLPEISIPLNTFRKTLVRTIMAGDGKQAEAFLASCEANEVAPLVPKPFFQELCQVDDKERLHKLIVQHRSHPNILNWANKALYEGRIASAPEVSRITAVDKTIVAFMAKQTSHARTEIKSRWSQQYWPRIIVVDIHHECAAYPGSSGYWNRHEAEFAAWLREAMLQFTAPQGGRTLVPDDIGLISPYGAQVHAMADIVGAGTIVTVAQAPGSEYVVGISSFTWNDPEEPVAIGRAADPVILNVMMSRPKRVHFILGNFLAQYKAKFDVSRAKRKNDPYVTLLEELGSEVDAVVLKPRDFRGWPGFSSRSV